MKQNSSYEPIRSLDLNEKWKHFLSCELKQWAIENPHSKFKIICWTDELVIDSAHIINDYLVDHQCPERLKTGAQIIGKSRTVFYDLTKKEIL